MSENLNKLAECFTDTWKRVVYCDKIMQVSLASPGWPREICWGMQGDLPQHFSPWDIRKVGGGGEVQ